MPTFSANPDNFGELLQMVKDGHEIALTAGEYKGPFTIERAIALRGEGENTVIFASDEPALKIAVPGVKLENLSVQRTVGGNTGEVAIAAAPNTAPVLDRVRCLGTAPNVQWLGVSWDIPTAVHFGEIQTNRYLQRTEQLQLGGDCTVSWSQPWLQVQQPCLSCGLQKLDIALNSQDIPAGTNLSGFIFLQASSQNFSIEISAIVTAPQTSHHQSPLSSQIATATLNEENWGYRFLGNQAIDYLIREIEGKNALLKYPEFSDRRDRAQELLSDILGDEPRPFYVRRKGPGEEAGEEKWELAIATDIEAAKLPEILEKRQKTLSLVALVTEGRSDGLRLLSARLVSPERGRSDGFSVLFFLSLHLNHQSRMGVPISALNRMKTVPFCGDCVPTEEQLKGWKAFLKIEERIAKTREFFVPFYGHNYGSATRKITFEITVSEAKLDKSSGISLKQDDFWTRAAKARNEDIKLVVRVEESREEDDSTSGKESVKQPAKWNAILLGSIEEIDREKGFVRVRLDSELVEKIGEGHYQLPKIGFLSFEAAGDLTQIKRQKKALDDLQMGIAQNPYVGEFFFDASQARPLQTTVKLKPEDLLLSGANEDQVAAVEAVLSAPDLVLIQGPPGTGKTTVIAEISYQVALRGGRTLIASQANLAVDNALSRLIHSPVIRALRKGRAERVEEEGLPFLEDKVIGNWLRNTADDCEKRLVKQRENIDFFRELLVGSERFYAYLRDEENLQESQEELRWYKVELEETCKAQESVYEEAEAKQREVVEYFLPSLESLMSKSSVDWEDVAVINLLTAAIKLCDSTKDLRLGYISEGNFKVNVEKAARMAAELGLQPPHDLRLNPFSLAAWLKEQGLPQIQMSLSHCINAISSIREAAEAARTLREKSAAVQSLETNYQRFITLTAQKNLQETIKSCENKKLRIVAVRSEINQWKSTAYQRIYVAMKQCVETNRAFTDELIQLPLDVVSFVKANPAPWGAHLDKCKLKIAILITRKSEANKIALVERQLNGVAKEVISSIATTTRNWLSQQQELEQNQKTSVLKSLKNWESTAYESVYEELKKCVEERRRFTDNMIKLPPDLLASVPVKPQPWRSNLDRCRSKIANLIAKQSEVQIPNFDAELTPIAAEAIDGIAASISQWLEQKQPEAEKQLQQLKQQLKEQQQAITRQQQQQQAIANAKKELEVLQREAEAKSQRAMQALAELSKESGIPANLRSFAMRYQSFPSLSQAIANIPVSEFPQRAKWWENQINQFEKLISSLDPLLELRVIKNALTTIQGILQKGVDKALNQLRECQNQLQQMEVELQQLQQQLQLSPTLISERKWWESAWQTIPDRLKPPIPANGLFDLNFLRTVKAQFDAWHQQLTQEEYHLKRYQNLIQDWIAKLRNPSEQDQSELRRIYIDNANVIGITCSQVAGYGFKEFSNFDVVIIDEVSKCTPPEILIPALKGKKLVLIGDYRQLPPMLHEKSLEEIATEMGSEPDDINFLEESLFKKQFETAPESIKRRLTIQYRMHPHIMGAINQFYDHSLRCGIIEPEKVRSHNLAGDIIRAEQHLIWVKMPQEQSFEEQLEGTSRYNLKEVDAIDILCEQMEDVWSLKVAEGQPKKEIGIITFYGAQLRRIEEMLSNRKFPSLSIRTGTVDRFQGMERPIIIVSMVRNNSEGDIGFAKKPERVNVAFSRAQELLVIVGCHSLFTKHKGKVGSMYSEVANIVRRNGGLIDVSSILS
ncbi:MULTISPECIES: AAA domain-containing protein [Kamptonema]|uniref:AAA domain-containing protein n=1 Tax=Kamptonema TaxID=1501433 RepID=UPI0001DACBF5|nr:MULTISPECIES: AAA domain-containing protein [Kamptonema]CBN55034.1 putative Superfamily I DNA and RNA helicases and helicase subunits-like [Kamptonema sp. PCC 6506]